MTFLALPLLGGLAGAGVLAAVQSQAALSLDTELGVGSAPYVPGEPAQTDVNAEVRPAAAIRFRTPRMELVLRFGPRFYYRVPLDGQERRPLALGQTALLHTYQFSERLRSQSQLTLTFGQANYAATETALKTPLARGLTAPVMKVLTLQGFTAMYWDASRSTRWELMLVADHNEVSTVPETTAKSSATSLGAVVSPTWTLSERDAVSVPARVRYYFVSTDAPTGGGAPTGGADTLIFSLGGMYRRTLDRRTNLTTLGGLALARIQQPTPEPHWTWKVAPQAFVTLDHVLHEQATTRVSNSVTVSIDEIFDPTTNIAYPVAGISTMLNTQPGTYWGLWFMADAYSAVTRTTAPLANSDMRASASVGATRRLTLSSFLMAGARASTRSSQPWANHFEISEKAWTLFLRFGVSYGLAKDDDGTWAR